jgi:hypothetical protein
MFCTVTICVGLGILTAMTVKAELFMCVCVQVPGYKHFGHVKEFSS